MYTKTKPTPKTQKLSREFILPVALVCPTTNLLILSLGKKWIFLSDLISDIPFSSVLNLLGCPAVNTPTCAVWSPDDRWHVVAPTTLRTACKVVSDCGLPPTLQETLAQGVKGRKQPIVILQLRSREMQHLTQV